MTGPGAVVRPATAADVPDVAALEAECLGEDAWSEGLVEQGILGELPTVHYLVAEVDGTVVGHAVASVVADVSELQRIGVTVGHRRTGVAARLLAEVVRLACEGGADRLLLEVRDDNLGALRFYAAAGFVEVDRRPRYYRDGTTAVVLRLPLVKGCG